MQKFLKPYSYFFFVQSFFKTKKIYFIFFLYTAASLAEMMNIGIIIPFLNMIFYPEANNFNFFFFNSEDFIIKDNSKNILIIFILSLFVIKSIILTIAAKQQANFYSEMRTNITTYFYNLYISKPYIYFLNERDSSKIIRNITMLSSSYSGFLERFLLLINDFFIFLGVVIILFIYDPVILTVVFITLIFFSLLFTQFSKKYFFRLGKSLLELSSDLIKDIQETLDNILQIKLLKKVSYFRKQFNYLAQENNNKVGKLTFLQSLPKIFLEMIAVTLLFLLIFYLIYFDKSQEEILTMLTLFAFATLRVIPLSTKLIAFLNTSSSFFPSLELLYNELKNQISTEVEQSSSNDKPFKIENIKLKNVSFFYEGRNKILFKDVNLNFEKDKIYGIVGETGSGKTSLVNLITGLLKPTSGEVTHNNNKIDETSNKKIGYVSQNTYLQTSSIKNNIAFGCEDHEIDDSKINECLKLVKLDKLINELPLKTETKVSELGANFSGGQIQRLSIARSLYIESDLIIFDEPTSSLDQDTKNEILKMIFTLKKNRIIFMISHTDIDLKICDEVLKVKDNRVTKIK